MDTFTDTLNSSIINSIIEFIIELLRVLVKVFITNHQLWCIKLLVRGLAPVPHFWQTWSLAIWTQAMILDFSAKKKIKVPYPLIKQAGMSNFFFTLKKLYIFVIKYKGLTWQMTAFGLKGNPWIHTNLV